MHNNNNNKNQTMQEAISQNPYINQEITQKTVEPQQAPLMQNPYINLTQNLPQQQPNILGQINSNDFIKGALIGAGVTYLLTNENVQKAIMKTVARGVELFQSGIEEMKEKCEDAKAEIEAEKDGQ